MDVCWPPEISGQLRKWKLVLTSLTLVQLRVLTFTGAELFTPLCQYVPQILRRAKSNRAPESCILLPLLVYTPFSGGPSLWRPQEAPLEYSPSCCGHAWSPGSRRSWSCPPCHACRTWAPWWWGTSPDSSWSQSAHPWWRSDLTWHCSWYAAWIGTSAHLAYR